MFDVRCLPNPHWEPNLRPLTGQDPEVIAFLQGQEDVQQMLEHIKSYLDFVIPKFIKQNRYYLTVSIGCTVVNIVLYLWLRHYTISLETVWNTFPFTIVKSAIRKISQYHVYRIIFYHP